MSKRLCPPVCLTYTLSFKKKYYLNIFKTTDDVNCFSHHARCTKWSAAGSHQPLGRFWYQQPRPRSNHGVCPITTPAASTQPQQPLHSRCSQRNTTRCLCLSLSRPAAPPSATTTKPATSTTAAAVTWIPAQPQPFHRHWGALHARQELGPLPAAA